MCSTSDAPGGMTIVVTVCEPSSATTYHNATSIFILSGSVPLKHTVTHPGRCFPSPVACLFVCAKQRRQARSEGGAHRSESGRALSGSVSALAATSRRCGRCAAGWRDREGVYDAAAGAQLRRESTPTADRRALRPRRKAHSGGGSRNSPTGRDRRAVLLGPSATTAAQHGRARAHSPRVRGAPARAGTSGQAAAAHGQGGRQAAAGRRVVGHRR